MAIRSDLYALARNAISREHGFPGISYPAQIPASVFSTPFGTLKGIDQNFKNASGQQFNLSMQRQLTPRSSFTIGYVASITHHLSWANPIHENYSPPGRYSSETTV